MQLGLALPVLAVFLHIDAVRASQRFCGKHLSDSLSIVCGSRGFYWQEDKRTGLPVLTKRQEVQELPPGEDRKFETRGIIEECCENPCTLSNLEHYCAPDDKSDFQSTADIETLLMSKPAGQTNWDGVTQPVDSDHVTRNPQLLSRLQDLRARLRDSETSRSRLVSRRPFFFVRPISRRFAKMDSSANGGS